MNDTLYDFEPVTSDGRYCDPYSRAGLYCIAVDYARGIVTYGTLDDAIALVIAAREAEWKRLGLVARDY